MSADVIEELRVRELEARALTTMMLSEDSVRSAASALVVCGAAGTSLEALFREKMKAMADSTGSDVLEALGALEVSEGPEGIVRAHEAVTVSVCVFIREQKRLFKSLSDVASKEFRSRRGGDAGAVQGDDASAVHAKLKATQESAIDWERSVSQYFSCFEDTGRTLAAVLTALHAIAERESVPMASSTAEVKKSVNKILRRIDASSVLDNIAKCKTCSKKFDDRIEKAAEEAREKERAALAEEEAKNKAKKGGWLGRRRRKEEEEEEKDRERERKRAAEAAASRPGRSKLGGKISQYEMLTAIREASSTLQDSVVDYFHLTQAIWESFNGVGVKCEQISLAELLKGTDTTNKGDTKKKKKKSKADDVVEQGERISSAANAAAGGAAAAWKAKTAGASKGGAKNTTKGGGMKALEDMLNDLEEEDANGGGIHGGLDALSLSSDEDEDEDQEEDEEANDYDDLDDDLDDDIDMNRIERSPAGYRKSPDALSIGDEAAAVNPFGQVDLDDDDDESGSDIAPPSPSAPAPRTLADDSDDEEESGSDRKSTPASYQNPFGTSNAGNMYDDDDNDDDDEEEENDPAYENPFASSSASRSPSRSGSAAIQTPFGNVDDDNDDSAHSDEDIGRASGAATTGAAAAGAVLSTPFGDIESSPRPFADAADVEDEYEDDDAGTKKMKRANSKEKKGKEEKKDKKPKKKKKDFDVDVDEKPKKKDKTATKKKGLKKRGQRDSDDEEYDIDRRNSDYDEEKKQEKGGRERFSAPSKSVYRHPLDEEEDEKKKEEVEEEEMSKKKTKGRKNVKEKAAAKKMPTPMKNKKASARSVFETPESDDDDDNGGGADYEHEELEIPDPLAPPSLRAAPVPLKLDKSQKRGKRSICSLAVMLI